MATVKFSVPNWGQSLIAAGAGLDPKEVVVRLEDDRSIIFLQHNPRKEFHVNKINGSVLPM